MPEQSEPCRISCIGTLRSGVSCWTCPDADSLTAERRQRYLDILTQEARASRLSCTCGAYTNNCICPHMHNRTLRAAVHDLLAILRARTSPNLPMWPITTEMHLPSVPMADHGIYTRAMALYRPDPGDNPCPACRHIPLSSEDERHVELDAAMLGWGVEIETLLPRRAIRDTWGEPGPFTPGEYHVGREIEAGPPGWLAEKDSSLSTQRDAYYGVECVSPVLHGEDGLDDVEQMTEELHQYDARINNTCMLHVHVGTGEAGPHAIRHVQVLFSVLEFAFFASCGKEVGRVWNHPRMERSDSWLPRPYGNRYQTLNSTNIHPTCPRDSHWEMRIWPGTVQMLDITSAIHLAVAVVVAGSGGYLPPDDADVGSMASATRVLDDVLAMHYPGSALQRDVAREWLGRRAAAADMDRPYTAPYLSSKADAMRQGVMRR